MSFGQGILMTFVAVVFFFVIIGYINGQKEKKLHEEKLREEEENRKYYENLMQQQKERQDKQKREEEEERKKFIRNLRPMQDKIINFLKKYSGKTFSEDELRTYLRITTQSEDKIFTSALDLGRYGYPENPESQMEGVEVSRDNNGKFNAYYVDPRR